MVTVASELQYRTPGNRVGHSCNVVIPLPAVTVSMFCNDSKRTPDEVCHPPRGVSHTRKRAGDMEQRLNYHLKAPKLMQAVLALNDAVEACGLERSLLHLIKLRASQINGCSFCVDMHAHEARMDGESEQRLYLVSAWRESPLFTGRERAAFAWTEAVTLVAQGGVPDQLYAETLKQFSEEELVKLTVAVSVINTWNRLSVAFRTVHPVRVEKA